MTPRRNEGPEDVSGWTVAESSGLPIITEMTVSKSLKVIFGDVMYMWWWIAIARGSLVPRLFCVSFPGRSGAYT